MEKSHNIEIFPSYDKGDKAINLELEKIILMYVLLVSLISTAETSRIKAEQIGDIKNSIISNDSDNYAGLICTGRD